MKLQLYYPTKPFDITQSWDGNGDYYRSNGIPIAGHNGIDIRTYHGQPVYASHDGMAYYQVDSKSGHGVIVLSEETFEYNHQEVYFKTIYWHLCDPVKEPRFKSPITPQGVKVKAGDLLGYADNTGLSTGDHLHFGLKPMMKINGIPNLLEPDNGYLGNIDPTPYWNGTPAEDVFLKLTLAQRIEEAIREFFIRNPLWRKSGDPVR